MVNYFRRIAWRGSCGGNRSYFPGKSNKCAMCVKSTANTNEQLCKCVCMCCICFIFIVQQTSCCCWSCFGPLLMSLLFLFPHSNFRTVCLVRLCVYVLVSTVCSTCARVRVRKCCASAQWANLLVSPLKNYTN